MILTIIPFAVRNQLFEREKKRSSPAGKDRKKSLQQLAAMSLRQGPVVLRRCLSAGLPFIREYKIQSWCAMIHASFRCDGHSPFQCSCVLEEEKKELRRRRRIEKKNKEGEEEEE